MIPLKIVASRDFQTLGAADVTRATAIQLFENALNMARDLQINVIRINFEGHARTVAGGQIGLQGGKLRERPLVGLEDQ
jgi:hypothetical protein